MYSLFSFLVIELAGPCQQDSVIFFSFKKKSQVKLLAKTPAFMPLIAKNLFAINGRFKWTFVSFCFFMSSPISFFVLDNII